ncbi:hypothetical protein O181_011049 [Austropuccinia psidii MF-1]|uniref:IMD domain-containing protein n=1 Tax=Austropuccinia psidii MF-1 TaxID=1389203 RepID=A0A9Q3BTS6_9BASI|nr:hypothetical protein [Austropuccinia psidii MF-1]
MLNQSVHHQHQHHKFNSFSHQQSSSDYPQSISSQPSCINFDRRSSSSSTSTRSNPNLILSKSNLKDSINSFTNLLSAAKQYRLALSNLSHATSSFAIALEECARLKGSQSYPIYHHLNHLPTPSSSQILINPNSNIPNSKLQSAPNHQSDRIYDSDESSPAEKLLAASGLHFLTANLQQVLLNTFQNSFEIPLSNLFNSYQLNLTSQQTSYESELSIKTKAIRDTELKIIYQGSSRHSRNYPRDLGSFRKGLKQLQDQVEQVESLKQTYYHNIALGQREIWKKVADSASLVVKSEVEIYDRIASKPNSDPTLESMVTSIPDPFDCFKLSLNTNPSSNDEPEIYSILPPLSSMLSGPIGATRKSLDLNDPTTTLLGFGSDRPPGSNQSSLPKTLPDHPHLNSTNHWVDSITQQSPPRNDQGLITTDQTGLELRSSYPSITTQHIQPNLSSTHSPDSPSSAIASTNEPVSESTLRAKEWLTSTVLKGSSSVDVKIPPTLRNVVSLSSTDSTITPHQSGSRSSLNQTVTDESACRSETATTEKLVPSSSKSSSPIDPSGIDNHLPQNSSNSSISTMTKATITPMRDLPLIKEDSDPYHDQISIKSNSSLKGLHVLQNKPTTVKAEDLMNGEGDEVESLLGQGPPSGIDLSDSDI